jgi:hypothetical protein
MADVQLWFLLVSLDFSTVSASFTALSERFASSKCDAWRCFFLNYAEAGHQIDDNGRFADRFHEI